MRRTFATSSPTSSPARGLRSDLGLPGMVGYAGAAALKDRDPLLPVCLVTGWGATLDAAAVKDRGIDMVLSKPFKFEELLKSVDRVLAPKL